LPLVGLDIGAISPDSYRDNSVVLRFGVGRIPTSVGTGAAQL
jgi:hypothetical protein